MVDTGEVQLPTGPLQTKPSPSGESEGEGNENGSNEGGQVEQESGDESKSASESGVNEGEDLEGMPSSGAGEQPDGGQELVMPGNPGAGILGDPSETIDSGWIVSNELPETQKSRGMPSSQDESEVLGEGEEEATASGSESGEEAGSESAGDEELNRVLSGIDGSIQSDRTDQSDRANERAGGPALPGNPVLAGGADRNKGQGDQNKPGLGGTSTQAIPNANGRGSETTPPKQTARNTGNDIPDARDDDVIARQLREAAIAETDPELKEALWDELRRYKEKRK